MLGITVVAGFLQVLNIRWILLWHRSPLRSWLLITPLYLIRTRLDEVRYWPLWEITDIKATHRLRNGVYQDTSLIIKFGEKTEFFTITPQKAHDELVSALGGYERQYRAARAANSLAHFTTNDDFRGFDPAATVPRPRKTGALTASIGVACAIIYGVAYWLCLAENIAHGKPTKSQLRSGTPPPPTGAPAAPEAARPHGEVLVR